jgi:hypothetical protein
MSDLSQLVRRVYPKSEPAELKILRACNWWQRAVSDRTLSNARPVRLDGGVLSFHTTSAAWANTLQLESDNLLKRMRELSRDCQLTELRFRVGRMPDPAIPLRELPEPPPTVPLTELPEDVARELARIRDDKLRDSVGRAVAMGLGRQSPPKDRARQGSLNKKR